MNRRQALSLLAALRSRRASARRRVRRRSIASSSGAHGLLIEPGGTLQVVV